MEAKGCHALTDRGFYPRLLAGTCSKQVSTGCLITDGREPFKPETEVGALDRDGSSRALRGPGPGHLARVPVPRGCCPESMRVRLGCQAWPQRAAEGQNLAVQRSRWGCNQCHEAERQAEVLDFAVSSAAQDPLGETAGVVAAAGGDLMSLGWVL